MKLIYQQPASPESNFLYINPLDSIELFRGVELEGVADAAQLALNLLQHAERSYVLQPAATEARRLGGLLLKTMVKDPTAGVFSFVPTRRVFYSDEPFDSNHESSTAEVLEAVVYPTSHLLKIGHSALLMVKPDSNNPYEIFEQGKPKNIPSKYNQKIKYLYHHINNQKNSVIKKYPYPKNDPLLGKEYPPEEPYK